MLDLFLKYFFEVLFLYFLKNIYNIFIFDRRRFFLIQGQLEISIRPWEIINNYVNGKICLIECYKI